MGLEYFSHIDCPIQKDRPHGEFRVWAKTRAYYQQLAPMREKLEAQEGKPFEDVQLDIPFTLDPPQERAPSSICVGNLMAAYTTLVERVGNACADCPLNLRKTLLGCYAAVTYPISAKGEQWLMEQFNPPEFNSSYILQMIRDNEITGQRMDSQRPVADRSSALFESPSPFYKDCGNHFGRVSSSQIIEFLFGCQPIMSPQSLFAFCSEFGAIEIGPGDYTFTQLTIGMRSMFKLQKFGDLDYPDWLAKLRQGTKIRMGLSRDDERSIYKFKEFFLSCWYTVAHGGAMAIDG